MIKVTLSSITDEYIACDTDCACAVPSRKQPFELQREEIRLIENEHAQQSSHHSPGTVPGTNVKSIETINQER